jgi:tetratricopeptide (TPR) repeat protein|tara:strand:- start:103 stop:732 length:630 start_codon:yes stop_codon:yes gene_type:complete
MWNPDCMHSKDPSNRIFNIMQLAYLYESLDNLEVAVDHAELARQTDQTNLEVQIFLAECYFELRQYSDAADRYEDAFTLDPKPEYANHQGKCCLRNNDFLRVTQIFNQSIHENPSDYVALNGRGEVLRLNGNYEKAREDFNSALVAIHETERPQDEKGRSQIDKEKNNALYCLGRIAQEEDNTLQFFRYTVQRYVHNNTGFWRNIRNKQ